MSDFAPAPPPLARECDVLCRFLVGAPATPYVTAAYERAHRISPPLAEPPHGFDRVHVAIAGRGVLAARLADSYARVLRPAGALRRKLVLLVAILESCSPSYRAFERPDRRSAVGTVLLIVRLATGFVAATVLAVLLFAPLHMAATVMARARPARPLAATPHPRADGACIGS